MQYRSTRKAVFSVNYHVICCPKYRRRLLGGVAELRLSRSLARWSPSSAAMVIEVETMPDHVHLLVELLPQAAVSKLVEIMKGRSSRRLRQEFPHLARMKCWWAPSPPEVVRRYVENQKLAAGRGRVKAA